MSRLTVEELEGQKKELMVKYWNKERHCWNVPTPEEVKSLQQKMRTIQIGIKELKELEIVLDPETSEDQRLKYLPLVSRRQFFETHNLQQSKISFETPTGPNILTADGDNFCFEAEKFIDVTEETCACGFLPSDWEPVSQQEIATTMAHMEVCKNKKLTSVQEPIHRIKHSRGNWDCKGCIPLGQKVEASRPIDTPLEKYIDWCPRFPEQMRGRSIELAGVKPQDSLAEPAIDVKAIMEVVNNYCYAGLMHSQIEFGEREQVEGKLIQHLKMVRVCDTCGYREVEEKTSESEIPPEEFILKEADAKAQGFEGPQDDGHDLQTKQGEYVMGVDTALADSTGTP